MNCCIGYRVPSLHQSYTHRHISYSSSYRLLHICLQSWLTVSHCICLLPSVVVHYICNDCSIVIPLHYDLCYVCELCLFALTLLRIFIYACFPLMNMIFIPSFLHSFIPSFLHSFILSFFHLSSFFLFTYLFL